MPRIDTCNGADRRTGYGADSYRRAISRACRELGIPNWSPNQLRHNAATRIRNALGIDFSKEVLGHSLFETTDIYVELDIEKTKRAMEKLG